MNVIPRDAAPTFSATPYAPLPRSAAPVAFDRKPFPPILPDQPPDDEPELLWVSGENTVKLDYEKTIITAARLSAYIDGPIEWITTWTPVIESNKAPTFNQDADNLFVLLAHDLPPGTLSVSAIKKKKTYGPIVLSVLSDTDPSKQDAIIDKDYWQLTPIG